MLLVNEPPAREKFRVHIRLTETGAPKLEGLPQIRQEDNAL